MQGGRIILHVDMDAFYAAVEERDDPRLVGRPVVIGADPRGGQGRGVACTANYAARAYGIHSALPISTAWRCCPEAVFLRPDFPRYKEASRKVMDTLAQYADVLQVVGMDEAYLEITQAAGGDWSRVPSIARSLQAAVRRAAGLPCSVGAASCKQVAKVASDFRKPHGVTVVTPSELQAFLDPLPVGKLHGCGPKSAARLQELGYPTVGELRQAPRAELEHSFGSHGAWLWRIARGDDPRPVVASRSPAKSSGNESTFAEDVLDPLRVRRRAGELLEELLGGARRDNRAFATLTVKVRYRGFQTVTRAHTFPVPLEPQDPKSDELARACTDALLAPLLDDRPVRLVGVRLSSFGESAGQRSLAAYGIRSAASPRPCRTTPLPWGPRQAVLAS